MEWVECQNDECKFRTSGLANGKDRRKRLLKAHLEGNSKVLAKCPVCNEEVVWKSAPEKMGILITGNTVDLINGIRQIEKFVYDDIYAKRFVHRASIAADEIMPNNEEIVENNKKILDKDVDVVLDNLFGKPRS